MSSTPSTARRLRRWTAGAALITFPAVLIPQTWIDPASGGTGEVMFRAATESRGALTVSLILLMLSGALIVPAVSGVLHQARDRGAGIANVGAVLAVLGGFGQFGIAMFYVIGLSLPGGDRTEMIAYVDRLNESAVLGYIAFPLILCFALGVAVLPWAAWRAGAVHWWVPALITVAIAADFGLPFRNTATVTAVFVAITVAYTVLGLRVLRMTDSEWDGVRTPAHVGTPLPA